MPQIFNHCTTFHLLKYQK